MVKNILIEATTKSIETIWQIMIIVVPVMVIIRIAKNLTF